jgi:hypothetical protein
MLPEEAQRRWISGREIRPHPIGPENRPPSTLHPAGCPLAGPLRLWNRALRPPRVIVIRVTVMTEEAPTVPVIPSLVTRCESILSAPQKQQQGGCTRCTQDIAWCQGMCVGCGKLWGVGEDELEMDATVSRHRLTLRLTLWHSPGLQYGVLKANDCGTAGERSPVQVRGALWMKINSKR